jgi:hypothetical protein
MPAWSARIENIHQVAERPAVAAVIRVLKHHPLATSGMHPARSPLALTFIFEALH